MIPKPSPDDLEKAKRKQMPVTARAWMAELEGVAKLVAHKTETTDNEGRQWWESTKRYNLARLYVLGLSPPSLIGKKAAREILSTLARRL